jgi:hypothetical protein
MNTELAYSSTTSISVYKTTWCHNTADNNLMFTCISKQFDSLAPNISVVLTFKEKLKARTSVQAMLPLIPQKSPQTSCIIFLELHSLLPQNRVVQRLELP